jgi:flagellar biosynthesis/type III secretory pathway protein FliH
LTLDAMLHERRHVIGVLYAEDFDAEDASEPIAPEPEVIEPLFVAAEMDAARAEGHAAGLIEAERGIAASRLQTLDRIATAMTGAADAAAGAAEAAATGIARTILGALSACLPALCERHGATELQALMRAVLPSLTDQPRVTVRVHPLMAPAMADEIAALDAELAERVVLLPSDAVPPGNVRVTWEDGAAQRDAGRARAALNEALAALGLLEEELTDA